MTKQQHTAGLLTVEDIDYEGEARRIVACWNATATIPTEALEAGVVGEMKEALKLAEKAFLSDPPHGPQKSIVGDDTIYHLDGGTLGHALDKVRAILTKVGGDE